MAATTSSAGYGTLAAAGAIGAPGVVLADAGPAAAADGQAQPAGVPRDDHHRTPWVGGGPGPFSRCGRPGEG